MSSPRSPITCHVLDSSLGRPAKDVRVTLHVLSQADEYNSKPLASGLTNHDGRCLHLLEPTAILDPGIYKLTFRTQDYFEATGRPCFYPIVEISFTLSSPSEHYHIPLLISPYSYTTYRGS